MFCFFNDTATTENYTYLHTLSLHDALPISGILRSLDYAASTAILNRSADQPQTLQTMALQVEEWQRLAAEAFLKGYNSTIGDCASYPADPAVARRLIDLFTLEKAQLGRASCRERVCKYV